MRGLIGLLCLGLVAGTALPAAAQSPVERGRYLVEVVGACGNCHTPKGPQGDVPGLHLAGGFQLEESFGTWITPNITPDPETGIGRWTDDEVIRAIREGRGRDGKTLGPPMPYDLYRRLADSDVKAMVAYLRTVAPVRNVVPRSRYAIPLPASYGPPVGAVPEPSRQDLVKYGEYLAGPRRALRGVPHPVSSRGPARHDAAGRGRAPVPRAVGRQLRREPDARP